MPALFVFEEQIAGIAVLGEKVDASGERKLAGAGEDVAPAIGHCLRVGFVEGSVFDVDIADTGADGGDGLVGGLVANAGGVADVPEGVEGGVGDLV